MRINIIDMACGTVFVLFGFFWGWLSMNMEVGTALRMGPGYFPLVVSGCLVVVGLLVGGKAFLSDPAQSLRISIGWRGLILLTAAPIVFALLIHSSGLVPSIAAAVLISYFASRRANLLSALILVVTLTALCVVIFHYGLKLPTPLFPWKN